MYRSSKFTMILLIVVVIAVLSIVIHVTMNRSISHSEDLPETSAAAIETIPAAEETPAQEEETTVPGISVYETVPVEGSSDPMVVFDLPLGAYELAPCRPAFESDQPLPQDGTNPVGILTEFDFGEHRQEVVIAENSEYQVSANQSLELHIEKNFFTWSPFNPAMQIGFCNMDTMKCYVYETLPGTHLDCYRETYVYPDLPEGSYQFCVRNLYEKPLETGYIRYTVSLTDQYN